MRLAAFVRLAAILAHALAAAQGSPGKKFQQPARLTDDEAFCSRANLNALVKGNSDACLAGIERCLSRPRSDCRAALDAIVRPPAHAETPKYFILTVGPPASGKGSVLQNVVYKELGIEGDAVCMVDVDAHVVGAPGYAAQAGPVKARIVAAAEAFEQTADPGTVGKQLKAEMNALGADSWAVYDAHRRPADAAANYAMTRMLIQSVYDRSRAEHIVYETTLRSRDALAWALQTAEVARKLGYTPVVVYPVVFRRELYRRALLRGTQHGRLPQPSAVKPMAVGALEGCMALAHGVTKRAGPYVKMFLVDNSGVHGQERLVRTIVPEPAIPLPLGCA